MHKTNMIVGLTLGVISTAALATGVECRDDTEGRYHGFSLQKSSETHVVVEQYSGSIYDNGHDHWSSGPQSIAATCTFSETGFFMADCTFEGVEHAIYVIKHFEGRYDDNGIVTFSRDRHNSYFGQDCTFTP
jgi:hypothetical protein